MRAQRNIILLSVLLAILASSAALAGVPYVFTRYPTITGTDADLTDIHKCSWGNYSNDGTDYFAPTQAQVNSFKSGAQALTGRQLYILEDPGQAWFEAQYGKTRVFCNQRFGDPTNGYSLWTVIFPSDQLWGNSQRRPIVIMPTGYGMSNNAFLFKEQRTYLAKVAEDYKCILVIANCGGTESMGTHSNIAGHLETLISYFHNNYGGDRNKVVFWGGSRGGFCSLFWGANPHNKNYTTVGIFADMPPIELGTMAYMPVANYINMGNIHNILEGEYTIDSQGTIHDTDSDVWRYTNRYASHCQALTGTTNKNNANLVGPLGHVSKYAGKIVSYNVGTNDTVIPFDGFQKLIQAFEAQSIAQSVKIVFGGGHTLDVCISGYTITGSANPNVPDDLVNTLVKLRNGQPVGPIADFHFYKSHTSWNMKTVQNLQPVYIIGEAPYFWVRAASGVGNGQPWQVELYGRQGHSWKYELYRPNGTLKTSGTGAFSSTERAIYSLPVMTYYDPIGTWTWKFYMDGQLINFETVLIDPSGNIPPIVTERSWAWFGKSIPGVTPNVYNLARGSWWVGEP